LTNFLYSKINGGDFGSGEGAMRSCSQIALLFLLFFLQQFFLCPFFILIWFLLFLLFFLQQFFLCLFSFSYGFSSSSFTVLPSSS
jgi:hypothetical protein